MGPDRRTWSVGPDQRCIQRRCYYVWLPSSIQNGAPDGIALANGGQLVEFLSYEGSFTGVGGVADGQTSVDVGAAQSGATPVDSSIQRSDDGTSWTATDGFNTSGAANSTAPALEARINEFHYDNVGGDTGEFIEIRANAGSDASSLSVELYNGSNGAVYNTLNIAGASMTSDGTYDYYVLNLPTNGLQNGSPDGIALINGADVVEFVSYEGSFAANGGAANGLTSTDIGAAESGSTPVGSSVQRSDDGTTWTLTEGSNTSGAANDGGTPLLEARINEFHYDNVGGDEGEFIEIRTTTGADASMLQVELYNGSNGAVYSTLSLPASPAGSDDDYDYYVIDLPSNGLQNGSPDGIALSNDGTLIEFLSYEGGFAGVGGAADGVMSTDVGQQETGSTPIGDSLQRNDDDSWDAPRAETKGVANDGGSGSPTPLLISEIQGSGATSSRVGELVTVTAIVVGDFQDGDADTSRDLRGFFLQEEASDQDANPLTSEGIFVFEGTGDFLTDVNIGDRVEVTGTVGEFFGQTQITAESVTIVEAGAVTDINTLAASINLDAAGVSSELDGEGRYVPDLEAYESMLVSITDTLTINEMFQLDRFNEIRLTTGDRPEQFTQNNEPDVAAFDAYQQQIGSDQIFFDDGLNVQNAAILSEADLNGDSVFNTADGFTMGDTITGLTGVLNYTWAGNASSEETWRIRSAEDDANTFVDTEQREDTPPDVGGTLTVASFNVLNFFTTLDVSGNPGSGPNALSPRGADNQVEYDRQLEKLVTTLVDIDADIFGLVELENEFGGDQNGDGLYAIKELTDALNTALGSAVYSWVMPGQTSVDTGDAISVGMIYKPSSVTLTMGSVEILTDSDLAGLPGDYGSNPLFDGVSTNRAPLAATFTDNASGEDFTVAVTHMKSKGGTGTDGDADQNDGAGAFNETRTEGVEALTDWLDTFADEDVLVLGDFNAYAQEDPIDAIIADGYTNLEGSSSATFVFDGQTGTLDYAFANAGILDNVTGAQAWHINSDEPDAIDYNTDFGRDESIFDGSVPYRTSDHDPLLIGLDFTPDDMNVV